MLLSSLPARRYAARSAARCFTNGSVRPHTCSFAPAMCLLRVHDPRGRRPVRTPPRSSGFCVPSSISPSEGKVQSVNGRFAIIGAVTCPLATSPCFFDLFVSCTSEAIDDGALASAAARCAQCTACSLLAARSVHGLA